jgi:hypothetical protein
MRAVRKEDASATSPVIAGTTAPPTIATQMMPLPSAARGPRSSVPYAGMPEAAVDRIKAGEIAMEIDWVRVHRMD